MSLLRFDRHGLSVRIAVEDRDLRAYIAEQFETERSDDSEAGLEIRASWRWGEPVASPLDGVAKSRLERIGRGVTLLHPPAGRHHGGGHPVVVWSRVPGFPELTLAFDLEPEGAGRLRVEARCGYAPRGVGRRLEYLRSARIERKRSSLFFKLMYFLVYYPMAWWFERTRGWGLLHASAVMMPSGRAVILSGLGGVGKSTLGLALLARPGARLLSDNLLFHDDARIYSCPEPVRLDASALAGMARGGVEPERTRLPLSAHPKPTYRVGPGRRAEAAPPAAVCFLRFGPRADARPLTARQAAQLLTASGDLAAEVKDYRPTAAVLTMLAAECGGPPAAPRADLERLLAGARCLVFQIGEGEAVSDTAARLMETALRMEAAG